MKIIRTIWAFLVKLFQPSKKKVAQTTSKPSLTNEVAKPEQVEGQTSAEVQEDLNSPNQISDPSEPSISNEYIEREDTLPVQRYCWCIDPGHGALTKGKRSPVIPGLNVRFYEYTWNREIVNRMIPLLERHGIAYMITVPEVNVGNFLKERVRRANEYGTVLPKIFLSIHANAGPATSIDDWTPDYVNGTETWYFHQSEAGRKLALIFQRQLLVNVRLKDRGIKSKDRKQFYVLRATKMPAVLTESGFFNNRNEVLQLIDPNVQQRIAEAHVAAILEIEKYGL